MSGTKLFEPIQICGLPLQHRVVMAPLTRFRVGTDHAMLPIALEYYTQRASVPGTLLIAEAVSPSLRHCAGPHGPGIWSEPQIARWRQIVDAVHAKGCFMVLQLCAPGRAGPEGVNHMAPSAVPITPASPVPRAMSEDDIQGCIADFAAAAKNAMAAGFDGVEVHGANGYLIDQFTQDVSNSRSDRWGGSVENRARFGIEVTRAVIREVGSHRVGYRVSPWSNFQSMRMADPTPQFSFLAQELKGLDLGYLHVIESRVNNIEDVAKVQGIEFLLDIWDNQSPVLVAGGFGAESAKNAVDNEYAKYNVAVVFGRYFVSTPDLIFRLRNGIAPNPYDRTTFYTPVQPEGYIDYPFSHEFLATQA